MPSNDLNTRFNALTDDVAGGVLTPPVDVIERRARKRTRVRNATIATAIVALAGGAFGLVQLRDPGHKVTVAAMPEVSKSPHVPIPATPDLVIVNRGQGNGTASLEWEEASLAPNNLSTEVAARIDASLAALTEKGRAEFEAEATANPPVDDQHHYAYVAKISTEPTLPGLLTISMQVSIDMGGAHPMPVLMVRTYDLTTGAEVQAEEIVREDALPQLQSEARDRLQAFAAANGAELDPSMLEEGIAPTFSNYRLMWPAPDGLHVTFSAYQVAPYVFGQPEIVIPWSIARDWVPSGSPIHLS